jgi:23S rRNA (uracil1939-C5)-methyltransferase
MDVPPPPAPSWSAGSELELRIDALGRGGDGLSRLEGGLLAFTPRTLPGELVRARVREQKGRRLELELVAVLEPAAGRVEAPCELFARCGGCQLQHLGYEAQLVEKRAQLVTKLARLLGPDAERLVEPTVASPRPLGYRNKSFLQRGEEGLGFYDLHGERVIAVERCPLAEPGCDDAMRAVRGWLGAEGASWREILLAVLVRVGEQARHVILVGDQGRESGEAVAVARTLASRLPGDGLFTSFKPAGSRAALGKAVAHLAGPQTLSQRLGPFTLELGPTSFGQVNLGVAAELYARAVRELAPSADGEVLDLYCGSGALALHLARASRAVLGVELDHRTLEDARRAAERHGLANVAFRAGRCETIAERLWKQGRRFRLASFNPPRLGMHPALPRWLDKLGLERAVYVSCSPPTLVRDLARLRDAGFAVERVVPFDQFAQTYHLEVLVTLARAPRA